MFVAAYIDPSSMTYLIQIIAGVVIAAGAGIGFYWKRIKRYFRSKKENAEVVQTSAPTMDLGDGKTITAEMLRANSEANETADSQVQE